MVITIKYKYWVQCRKMPGLEVRGRRSEFKVRGSGFRLFTFHWLLPARLSHSGGVAEYLISAPLSHSIGDIICCLLLVQSSEVSPSLPVGRQGLPARLCHSGGRGDGSEGRGQRSEVSPSTSLRVTGRSSEVGVVISCVGYRIFIYHF